MGGSFVNGGRLIAAPTRRCESASRGRTESSAPTQGCPFVGPLAGPLCSAAASEPYTAPGNSGERDGGEIRYRGTARKAALVAAGVNVLCKLLSACINNEKITDKK